MSERGTTPISRYGQPEERAAAESPLTRLHEVKDPKSLRCEDFYAVWARRPVDEVKDAADAYNAHLRQVEIIFRLRQAGKSHTPAGERRMMAVRREALDAVDEILGRGLLAREGRFVRPPAIVKPELLDDFLAWEWIKMCLKLLGGVQFWLPGWTPKTTPLSVCDGCTAVFRPARKKSARFCRLCAHKQPPPPLGMTGPLRRPGDTVVAAAPKLSGHVVTGWKEVTVGLCLECGDAFIGPAGKVFCSSGCGQRHRRRS
ncbi:MAG: hypothetical protein QM729_20460 [Solirubrobacterales bacterium]